MNCDALNCVADVKMSNFERFSPFRDFSIAKTVPIIAPIAAVNALADRVSAYFVVNVQRAWQNESHFSIAFQ